MFGNYLAAALRNLDRNKYYAAITIVGLALSFAAAILIGLYVRDEFSYDRFIPGYQDVYLISDKITVSGKVLDQYYSAPATIASQLKLIDPRISAVALVRKDYGPVVRHNAGDVGARDQGFAWVDPDFFKVLPLPVVAGDLTTALQQPDTVVITRSVARTYFGRDNPIGDTLDVSESPPSPDGTSRPDEPGDHHLLRVTAVLQDLPSDTHLGLHIFVSDRAAYTPLAEAEAHTINNGAGIAYVRLSPGASKADLQHDLDVATRKWMADMRPPPGVAYSLSAIPLADVHMHSPDGVPYPSPDFSSARAAGNEPAVVAIAVVGALIVLIGSTNFVTLMTARAGRRALEVGVRKVAGAGRRDLIVQFIGEALLYVALAMLVAVALDELLLPAVNAALQRTMRFDYLGDPALAGGIVATVLVVGLLAGLYPAFVLASFRPSAVLRGGFASGTTGSPLLRQALVALQFAILIGLILVTTTIYRQTTYALDRSLGGRGDPIVAVHSNCNTQFVDVVRRLPGVEGATCSSGAALKVFGDGAALVRALGGEAVPMARTAVDYDFFNLLNITPIAGRLFSRDHGEDGVLVPSGATAQPTIVIDEMAVRRLGFASPEKAIGQTVLASRLAPIPSKTLVPTRIVGVVPTIAWGVRENPDPAVYFIDPNLWGLVAAKATPQALPDVVKGVERAWTQAGDHDGPISLLLMSQLRQTEFADIIIQTAVVAACAAMALFVACLGLFALSAFTAEQRTKEIGVRKAMGASTWDVVLLLMWRFTQPVLFANLIAWPLAWLVMDRWLKTFAYHVGLPLWQFVMAAAMALLIAWAAIGGHAFLVARAKPAMALRYE